MPVGPTWRIGEVQITSIIEVEQHWKWPWLLPGVVDAQVEAVSWLRPHFVDDQGKLILRIQALVVESQGQRIVVDTCVGNNKIRPTPLFDRLQTSFFVDLVDAGFGPETIDLVVCTHLHVDHVGWNTRLVDGRWIPTFPGSRYLFGQVEYEDLLASDDGARFGDIIGDSIGPIVDGGLADFVSSDHALTDEVRLEPTPGHTPGHHSVVIDSAGHRAAITGDMIHHPIQFALPEISSSADTNPSTAISTRKSAFRRWHQREALIIGTHFAGPGAGFLSPAAGGADSWNYSV